MYQIRGLGLSSNTTKALYVAEELGLEYQFINVNLQEGEHKTPEHLERHPLGKLPTLSIGEKHLFESGAICRYFAEKEGQHLYPGDDPYQRALVDQWMNFFTCHPGRHINTYSFETVAKKLFGMGEPNIDAVNEAKNFIDAQLPVVEQHLNQSAYLAGDELSIADLYAFAYMENAEVGGISMEPYPAISAWYEKLKNRDSVKRAHQKIGMRLSDMV